MRLIEVNQAFATDEQCLAYLEHKRWPTGVRCSVCGNDKISRITRKKDERKQARKHTPPSR
jgi:hypothetical protein